MAGKKRLNLELSLQARTRLEKLLKLSEASTLTEVVKKSLHIYDILTMHTRLGGKIILRDKDGKDQELLFI